MLVDKRELTSTTPHYKILTVSERMTMSTSYRAGALHPYYSENSVQTLRYTELMEQVVGVEPLTLKTYVQYVQFTNGTLFVMS